MFEKFNKEYMRIAKAAYGGRLYLELKNYRQFDVDLSGTDLKKVPDAVLSSCGICGYFSIKNMDSGFCAAVFENIENGKIVIAYRGTERADFGENTADAVSWGKDIASDINLVTGISDRQFMDAWELFKAVKEQNPKSEIILTGHSLGGALAQLTAAKAFREMTKYFCGIKIKTYTYNAPGVKHLLKHSGCSEKINYYFIKNYAVMNDWCGMFGVHAGKTLLLPPIEIESAPLNMPLDAVYNILLNTHEGIFECTENTPVIKKTDNFNQPEGLSLWYYDKNNIFKNLKTPNDFLGGKLPKINLPPLPKFLAGNYEVFKSLSELLEKTMQEVSIKNLKNALNVLEKKKIPVNAEYLENIRNLIKNAG